MKKFLIIILFLFSCGKSCPKNYFENVTHYKVNPNEVTKSGFQVDTSSFDVDLDKLDERLLSIEKCLQDLYAIYPIIAEQEAIDWQCNRRVFNSFETLNRECMVIKIVEPIYSKCSSWEFIKECETCGPAYAPDEGCIKKGIIPTLECPCKFRIAIQDDWIIITPTALYLWDVVRMATGCNYMWYSLFSECTKY